MKWIRVECTIGDWPMIGALADALGVSIAEAVGLHALVWAKLPEHARDGYLSAIPDATLERWVSWTGKRGAFAEAFHNECCHVDGNEVGFALDWERVNGAAMRESEATTERVRKLREGRKATPDSSAPEMPSATPTARRTPPVRTPLNGTGRSTASGTAANTDPSPSETPSTNPVEKSVEKSPVPAAKLQRLQPPAAVAGEAKQPAPPPATPIEPTSVITRFMVRFYRESSKERRADIAKQTVNALLAQGVQFQGSLVRAVDAEHLDDCCLEVMEEPPRDNNAAWVWVLQKLRDTYLEVLSKRAKAAAGDAPAAPRSRLPEGMAGTAPAGATPIRASLAHVMEGLDEVSRGTEGDDAEG